MRKIAYAVLAVAAGIMAQGLTPSAANAYPAAKGGIAAKADGVTQVGSRRHFGGRHFGGHRFHGGRHFGGHRRFHRRHFYGPRIYFGPRYYSYGGGCYWLKRRAIYTGSHYWWRRYSRCRNGW